MTLILGRKRGMTQLFADDGTVTGVTVVEVGPCVVTQVKTAAREGYDAIQLGWEDVTDKRTGLLDQPCEALVRGNETIVSNMDWPFPKFKNTKHQLPATLSIIQLNK